MEITYGIKVTTGQTALTDFILGCVAGVCKWVTGRPAFSGWKEGIIAKGSFSPISQEIALARGGGYSTMSGFAVELAPMIEGQWVWKRIKDLGLNLVQAEAVVYCWRDGVESQDWSGTVADIEAAETGYRIQFMDAFRSIHGPMLRDLFDTVRFPDAPEKIKGKPIPVSIGRVGKNKLYPMVQAETYETVCINGGESLDFAPAENYTTSGLGIEKTWTVHLKTGSKVFTANSLAGKFLTAIKGGNESVLIVSNLASASGVTQIKIETGLSATPVFWSATGADVWYFQISSLSIQYLASKNGIYSLQSTAGKVNLFAFDSETEEFDSVADILDQSSLTNIGASGYPGLSLLSKPINLNGDSVYYSFAIPSKIEELAEVVNNAGAVTGTRPPPNVGNDLPLLRDREDSFVSLYTWICTSDADEIASLTIPLKVPIPASLVTSNFSNLYFGISQNTQFDVFMQFSLTLNIKLIDRLGRQTNALDEENRLILNTPENAGGWRIIPEEYYGVALGDQFGRVKDKLKLNASTEWIAAPKDLEIYPFIVFELTYNWRQLVTGSQITVGIREVTIVGEKSLNLLKDNLYTDLTGDLFSSTWDGRRTATNPVLNIADAVEHLIRNYDDAPEAIDTAAFDLLGHPTTGSRKDWAIGRQLTEEANSYDLCRELARFGMFGIIPRNNGKRALKAWMEADTAVAVHDASVIDAHSIGSRDQTDLADLFNDLLIQFAWNPASEKFDRQYRITKITEDVFPPIESPGWRTYAIGFTDAQYSLAAGLWAKCHLSYLKYGVVQTLPDELSKCYWFPDVVNDFGLTEANNAAILYLTEGCNWWPFRKEVVPYTVPNTAEHASLELLDRITLNDAFATDGEDEDGWIVRKAIVPGTGEDGKDYIEISLMLEPDTAI